MKYENMSVKQLKVAKLLDKIKQTNYDKEENERVVYVGFDFGSYAYVGVTIYKCLTLDENLLLRSESIERYYNEGTKKWTEITY